MKQQNLNSKITIFAAVAMLALSFPLVGCDRTISHTETKSTSSDGTVKSKEKTVTQSADGTVTKKESSETTTTNKP